MTRILKLKHLLENAPAAPVRTEPRPSTTPSRPAPVPMRPNPLRPTKPGISPRPKAISHDVSAFINARRNVNEAINIDGQPNFIHPEKRASIENEKSYVEGILPELGPAADKYIEIITSESYKNAITKITHYLGMSADQLSTKFPNLPTMMSVLMHVAQTVEQIEKGHKEKLEQMANRLVFNLPENKHLASLVKSGDIILDVKLDTPDLTDGITEEEMEEMLPTGLTVGETLNARVASNLNGNTEGKLRRSLANFITQGDAINKFFAFNLMNEELEKIHPNLPNHYGYVSAISMILNYWMPNHKITKSFISAAAVGSEQVVPDGDGYIIRVRARNFPLLVHELTKGLNDYLSMDLSSQEDLDTETLDDEWKQFMAGPGLDLRLRKAIPSDKLEYLPMIKKLLYRLPIDQIKEFLLGGGKSDSIMKRLIKTAEEQLQDFQ